MKILDKWLDSQYNITNYIIELPKCTKLVWSHNPDTKEFVYIVELKAGSMMDPMFGFHLGTAHFLEHFILGAPNKFLKSISDKDEYEQGTRKRAGFKTNGFTNRSFVGFEAYGNDDAAKRMIEEINTNFDHEFNQDFVKQRSFFTREKNVILNEIVGSKPPAKRSRYQLAKLIWGSDHVEMLEDPAGSASEIKKIKFEDLRDYLDHVFCADNTIITVQSKNEPDEELINEIQKLENYYRPNAQKVEFPDYNIEDEFRLRHFRRPENPGIFAAVGYYYKMPDAAHYTYKWDRLNFFLSALIKKLAFDYERASKGLIYDVSMLNSRLSQSYKQRGFAFECYLKNFGRIFDDMYDIIYGKKWKEFLETEKGKLWFESYISQSIFLLNENYDQYYAVSVAEDLFSGLFYRYDYDESRKVAQQLQVKDLIDFAENFYKIRPMIWVESPYEDKEVMPIIKGSKIYQKFAGENKRS